MNRLVVFAILLASAARADADGDDVDDHPLASDLRAAFGRKLSSCHGDECSFDLSAVVCTTHGTVTTYRAGTHEASGPNAVRLADHLREIAHYEDRENARPATPATVTIARITCRSYKVEWQAQLRGHCWVERTAGDRDLDCILSNLEARDGAPLLETCKLGQFCWTGAVDVACKSARCTLTCPAGSEGEWLDGCHLAPHQVVTVSDAALAKQVHARTGSTTATISCFTSGGAVDGGVTSLVACDARHDSH